MLRAASGKVLTAALGRVLTAALGIVFTAAVVLLFAGSAQASFGGFPGLLAIDPLDGHGVLLASAGGGVRGRVCPQRISSFVAPPTCTGISDATWSPDGRYLAFVQGSEIDVVYPDGSCISCGDRPLLQPPTIGALAFRGDGTGLLLGVGAAATGVAPAIATEQIDGLGYHVLTRGGAAAQPASGPLGEFAYVTTRHRHKVIVLVERRGARPIAIARGSSPNISPNGRAIVYVRGGWVRLIRIQSRRSHRLVRGSDPVFSPTGRQLAFLARGGKVRLVGLSGRHVHAVGRLTGKHLDWEPEITPQPRCPLPSGSKLIAGDKSVLPRGSYVFSASGEGYLACLWPTMRVLQLDGLHTSYVLTQFKFFGSYIAYLSEQFQDYPVCQAPLDQIVVADVARGTFPVSDFVADGCYGGPADGGSALDDWVVNASGGLAYLTTFGNVSGSTVTYTYTLTAHDQTGIRQLDSVSTGSTSSPITNLAVNGGSVTWDHDGQPRAASLGHVP